MIQSAFREPDCAAGKVRNTSVSLVNSDIISIGQPFISVPTLNGRYVFNLVERNWWELEAQERAVEVGSAHRC